MIEADIARPSKGAISVTEFCHWSGIGRTSAYEEISAGRLQAKKVGRRTIIPMVEAVRWMETLPSGTNRFVPGVNPTRSIVV